MIIKRVYHKEMGHISVKYNAGIICNYIKYFNNLKILEKMYKIELIPLNLSIEHKKVYINELLRFTKTIMNSIESYGLPIKELRLKQYHSHKFIYVIYL